MSSTANVQHEIEQIERSYVLRDREKVLAFLDQYSFLVPLLLETRPKISEYFPDRSVYLQVVADPDVAGWITLQALIQHSNDWEADDAILDRLDEDFWYDGYLHGQQKMDIFME